MHIFWGFGDCLGYFQKIGQFFFNFLVTMKDKLKTIAFKYDSNKDLERQEKGLVAIETNLMHLIYHKTLLNLCLSPNPL
jgi:hypothetical protein